MRFTIKRKLIGSFGLILLMMVTMGLVAFYMLGQVEEVNQEVQKMNDESAFTIQAELDHVHWLNELADTFIAEEKGFTGELDYTQCRFGQWYYQTLESEEFVQFSTQYKEMFYKLEEPHSLLHQSAEKINEIRQRDDLSYNEREQKAYGVYTNETQQYIATITAHLADIRDYLEREKESQIQEAANQSGMAKVIIVVVSLIAIVLGLVLALVLNSKITKPINNVVDTLVDLTDRDGDLTTRLEVKTNDEIKDLAERFNMFMEKLHDIISSVRNSAVSVTHSSDEIATGNQDLSQRTQEQASSLEEFSATVEEITSSMENTSGNAIQANNISEKTIASVKNGQSVVSDLQQSMGDITASSNEIAEIISTVNDIAFQTNLLALNAAVEAARAGEAGQGFAVVATEVRNLAGRSSEAADEIEKLIKNSIDRINKGNQLMGATEEVLEEIVDNTTQTSDVVGEIAASLKEQNTATTEINNTIEELNQVTQQNASLVEEIASSSENMSDEAVQLSELVQQFQLQRDKQNGTKIRENKKQTTGENIKKISNNKQVAATKEDKGKKLELDQDEFEKF
jgi:methyl-accepting chemotaxis protein